jgi:hypothetical protein
MRGRSPPYLEAALEGFVEQGGLGGGWAVRVDLVEDRARRIPIGPVGGFGVLPAHIPLPLPVTSV